MVLRLNHATPSGAVVMALPHTSVSHPMQRDCGYANT
jgi:hypothetical protein